MFKKSHLIIAIAASTAFAGIASAETQAQIAAANACYQSFQSNDYKAALTNCEKAANNGDAEAMNLMGAMYEKGFGTDVDYSKAFDYYKDAASKDQPDAINNLGDLYYKGLGVDQDYDEAKFYFMKAARLGDPTANVTMAQLLLDKESKDYSPEDAQKYLTTAADLGNAEAQYRLATMLITENSFEKAKEYLEKAVAQDYAKALVPLATIYKKGAGVVVDLEKALELYKKAADAGSSDGAYEAATMYANGQGTKVDFKSAFKYFDLASTAGDTRAQIGKAFLLIKGLGTEKNIQEGLDLLAIAGEKNSDALVILADELYNGTNVPQNYEEAFKYYNQCALKAVVSCQRMVGKMLADGIGVSRDPNYAISWLVKAAEQHYIPAMMDLGEIYYSDKYNHQDFETSKRYFREASELGDAEATEIMLTRDFK